MHPSTHILSFISILSLLLGSLTGCGDKRIHVAKVTETPGQEILMEPAVMKTEVTIAELNDASFDGSDLSPLDSKIDITSDSEEPSRSFASVMPNEPVNMAHAPHNVANEDTSPNSSADPSSSSKTETIAVEDKSSNSPIVDPSPSSIHESEFTEDSAALTENDVALNPLSEGQDVSAQSDSSIEANISEEAYVSDLSDNTAEFREDSYRPLIEPSSDLMDTQFSEDASIKLDHSFSEENLELAPDTFEIAKTQPSDNTQDQIDRIKKEELAAAAGLQDVFFPFDSWTLTKEGKLSLKSTLDWFKHDFSSVLIIEGHSDQRGTQAYNMILGKRRALAVREYLSKSGIDPSHLITISYGKDKPFCQDITEVCHQLNRRGHLLVQNP